jgi:uncharacterized damage-inducible protein DinB
MIFGYLANMVATIPMWIMMQINQNELDVAPAPGESKFEHKRLDTSAELIDALDQAAAGARSALQQTSDEHLKTNWRLLAKGKVVMEAPRYEMIQDTINHWAHHRGQMTVYLRLMGAKVPAIYGPSADDTRARRRCVDRGCWPDGASECLPRKTRRRGSLDSKEGLAGQA